MSQFDPAQVADCIRDVAANIVIPRFGRLAEADIGRKRAGTLVTVADRESEDALGRMLSGILPGSIVVGEEMVEDAPEILDHLGRHEPVWILDPIDGTTNFTEGNPDFALMVALMMGSEIVGGWIFAPVNDLFVIAEKGAGAMINGVRAHINAPSSAVLGDLAGSLPKRMRAVRDISERFGSLHNRRCVGVEYQAMAATESHFAYFTRLHPWDHAPGNLIHAEAGGFSACLEGEVRYHPAMGAEQGGLLYAPNEQLWREICDVIAPA